MVSGPRVLRVRADNMSPMTLDGTNTYLIEAGAGQAIAIDPGPLLPDHLDAILMTARERGLTIGAIAVTHGHPDHAPGAAPLGARTGAPVYAHANARFPHDRVLGEGDVLELGGTALHAIDAPGHARDHLVFWFEDELALFTGDVIIGDGSTVVIAPPGGDMRAYQRTLHRLRDEYARAARIYGGHDEEIEEPTRALDYYIAHRERREAELIATLHDRGRQTVPQIVEHIYHATPQALWPAAARQVFAYLIALEREGRVVSHVLDRPANAYEKTILDPDLSRIVDANSRAVAAAELGIEPGLTQVAAYELTEA
jgi:glyoxylase-like metal-dependent hydrolase (beta-lactamase superfamily II)